MTHLLGFGTVLCSLLACTEHASEKNSGPEKVANTTSPSKSPTAPKPSPKRISPKPTSAGTRLLETAFGSIFAVPYSDPSDTSPLLGKLTAIEHRFGDTTEPLLKHCLSPVVELAAKGPLVALECVSGQAAMNLTHSIFVVSLSDGKTLAHQELCRTAIWGNGQLNCSKEKIDANGELQLSVTTIFPTPK